MPIQKTTNIKASDLNALLGGSANSQISLGNISNTWFGVANSVSLGTDFSDTFSGTQQSNKIVPTLSDDPTDWYHRGSYSNGECLAISRDGSTMAVAKSAKGVHVFKWISSAWVLDTIVNFQGVDVGGVYSGVALNADGTTLAYGHGGYNTNANPLTVPGRIFIAKKTGSTWGLEATLEPTGYSVQQYNSYGPAIGNYGTFAISDDGNTLACGGPNDNGTRSATLITTEGAIYVFVRSGTSWSQQARITAPSRYCAISVNYDQQMGVTVAISADGNTIATGGPRDNCVMGSLYVFTRSGTTWSQQLQIASNATDYGYLFGNYCAISSDGNTMAITGSIPGSLSYNNLWIYTRSGTTWSQQYSRNTSSEIYGSSSGFVTMTSDGNTVVVSSQSSSGCGVYKRSGSNWSLSQVVKPTTTIAGGTVGNLGRTPTLSGDGSRLVFINTSPDSMMTTFTRPDSSSSYTQQGGNQYIKPVNGQTSTSFGIGSNIIDTTESNVFVIETAYKPNGAMSLVTNNSVNSNTLSISGNTYIKSQTVLSGDGKTMCLGNYYMANTTGAQNGGFMVFVKDDAGNWTQQSNVFPDDSVGTNVLCGYYTAISKDGNTIAATGPGDFGGGNYAGAVWIFTRTGTTWSKQQKIPGTVVSAQFGQSLAMSNDGNTIAVGAYQELASNGVCRIFTRTNGVWSLQQTLSSAKLGAQTTGDSFSYSLSMSGDGNTLAVSAPSDNLSGLTTPTVGTVFIYTRSGSTWTLKASLQANNYVGVARMGQSISLSGDGYTLAASSVYDNTNIGAVWIFKRQNTDATSWTQSNKLVPSDAVASQQLGFNIQLSKKGRKLIIGNQTKEGVWIYK